MAGRGGSPLNYRTTRQILAASLAVLQDVPIEDLDGESESTSGYRSALSGQEPKLRGYPDREAELEAGVDVVRRWLESDGSPQPGTIAVLTRRKRDAEFAARSLNAAGVPASVGGAGQRGDRRPVHVLTMHSAKGAEFRHVLLLHADDDTVPERAAVDTADADERDDVLLRERLLLYVACSRARDDLVVTWSGRPSRFLAGLAAGREV
ncbi:MAG: ATP-dependent helicase [Kineosporiaceae bacterium]|nr:ATP-dependent helicase [Kineosporiaceae bacterium]